MPKGATVSAATAAIHKDTTLYSNPYEFDGFRFSREADAAAAASTVGTNDPDSDQKEKFLNHKMFVTTSPEYLPFGHGKHACPGRFFASNELKLIMMHILRNYEFRLAPECGGKRPANQGIFGIIRPAMGKLVEFRRRK